ncbi:MAG: hypothetical protein LC808_29950 [Actinobacteria bacterium]|nr:hypothetical protein [Actinomycetota bacterium]
MSPRSEEFLAVARQRLEAARSSLAQGHPEVALSAAYVVLYAARAALSEQETSARWGIPTRSRKRRGAEG